MCRLQYVVTDNERTVRNIFNVRKPRTFGGGDVNNADGTLTHHATASTG